MTPNAVHALFVILMGAVGLAALVILTLLFLTYGT